MGAVDITGAHYVAKQTNTPSDRPHRLVRTPRERITQISTMPHAKVFRRAYFLLWQDCKTAPNHPNRGVLSISSQSRSPPFQESKRILSKTSPKNLHLSQQTRSHIHRRMHACKKKNVENHTRKMCTQRADARQPLYGYGLALGSPVGFCGGEGG